MNAPQPQPAGLTLVLPRLSDPRWTIGAALTLWTVLGQTAYYFNRDLFQLGVCIGTACALDVVISLVLQRALVLPLSAYITALSIGILVESYDWRVFVIAAAWGILSKYLLKDRYGHFFNPSNFGIVAVLALGHGVASVAPGSQWGADYRVAFVIIGLGLMMMKRVGRLDLSLAWLGGYLVMGLLRVALGQGGLVFAIGPLTGAEFALFTFSMLPDPKTSPPTRKGRILWGVSIAVVDGVLRYFEIRYSMFYSLFAHCAVLPILRVAAARSGLAHREAWNLFLLPMLQPRRDPVAETAVQQGSA